MYKMLIYLFFILAAGHSCTEYVSLPCQEESPTPSCTWVTGCSSGIKTSIGRSSGVTVVYSQFTNVCQYANVYFTGYVPYGGFTPDGYALITKSSVLYDCNQTSCSKEIPWTYNTCIVLGSGSIMIANSTNGAATVKQVWYNEDNCEGISIEYLYYRIGECYCITYGYSNFADNVCINDYIIYNL